MSGHPLALRPARRADAEAVARVQGAAWRNTYRGLVPDSYMDRQDRNLDRRIAGIAEWLEPPHIAFVAVTPADHVVGYAVGGSSRDPTPPDGELYAIYLLAGWQGVGAGRLLLDAVRQALADRGMLSMVVWVLADNPARRFYERMGGVPVGSRRIAFDERTLEEVSYVWSPPGG